MDKKKCRKCGRFFEAKEPGEAFCSPLCRLTGYFVGGGGDTTKPGAVKAEIAQSAGSAPPRVNSGDERFARVRAMLKMPESKRWEVAKEFTAEEQAYCRRLARRMLMEDIRIERESSWEVGEEGESGLDCPTEPSGDSDDGTI